MSPLRTYPIACARCGEETHRLKYCEVCSGKSEININIERILNPITSHLTVYEDCPNDPRIDI